MLSFGAVFAGWAFHDAFIGEDHVAFWAGAIATAPGNHILEAIWSMCRR